MFVLADLVSPWLRALFSIFDSRIFFSTAMSYLIGLAFMYLLASLIAGKRFKHLSPYIVLLPVYWIYLGLVALGTPFVSTEKWFKTERR